jgi:hypothetical protein
MVSLGSKLPIPSKRDEKAWRALRTQLGRARRREAETALEAAVRLRHHLEQEIKKLESMPTNEGRQNSIKHFRKMLKEHNQSMPPTTREIAQLRFRKTE